jgi:anion-transporting  ArsA/GET3 family ATPase
MVSEAGFMMEEETLRLIIRHLNELKMEINARQEELKEQLKTDIRAVATGQYDLKEELKNDMKSGRRRYSTHSC